MNLLEDRNVRVDGADELSHLGRLNLAADAFAAKNPHANIAAVRRAKWHGCCRYWNARGVPAGWWT